MADNKPGPAISIAREHDEITISGPSHQTANPSSELQIYSGAEIPVSQLELEEPPLAMKARSRFRLFAVMTALFVGAFHNPLVNSLLDRIFPTSYPITCLTFDVPNRLTTSQLSLFVAALDQTIIATAVPTIASSLSSSSGYVWVMSAYLLANAASGPIWSALSDIWGRKPVLLTALALFFASSILCALASSMRILIVARVLQGTGGGGLMLLVNICISDMFSMR